MDPRDLVDKRVSVLFKHDLWFEGSISCYDQDSNKHVVKFDDDTTGAYRLHKKTFKWEKDKT